ncbi:MAG: phosphoribosyltransferase family protein [Patescibacteria group bacterium]|nr:phosphoribosyltransferase family protein [Patescibacteria group bacterium]
MYFPVSWNELHIHTLDLARQLQRAGEKPDCIVAIARGGLAIANILSDSIHVPVSSFTVSTYAGMKKITEPELRYSVAPEIHGHSVLLLDDIADTGETLAFGLRYIESFAPKRVVTATLFYRNHSKHRPDYYVREVSEWVIFPFEITETIKVYHSLEKKEPARARELMESIKELNLPESLIETLVEGNQD